MSTWNEYKEHVRQTDPEAAAVIAEAEAKKKVIAANAEAEAIRAKAGAQADANKKIEESLSNKVLMYNQIEKWDGVMPKVASGNNGSLMIDVPIEENNSNIPNNEE